MFSACAALGERDPDTGPVITDPEPSEAFGVAPAGRIHRTSVHAADSVACEAIEVATIAAARGSSALDVTVLRTEHTDPMTVTLTRQAFVEVQQRQPFGLEQSWRFDRAAGQAGDLRIVVEIPGVSFLGRSSAGLHFQGPGCDVFYSDGTWIDAAGHHVAVPAQVEGGSIVLVVPASVVAQSRYPVVLDPEVIVDPR